jgi:DNA adenine methylase
MRKNPKIRPYVKWAGGKRQLLPLIRKELPVQINRYAYYEPFVGAGAVLFCLQPRRAVINDSNAQLMLTYRVIRDDVEGLIALLRRHKERIGKEYYYTVRAMDRAPGFDSLPDAQKAARLIFLNRVCFNGLYRVNADGYFNVPYGRYDNPIIYDESVLRAIHRYLRRGDVQILCGDFAQAVENADKRSLVYFDPPYHSPEKGNFTSYQAGGFGEPEQIRLRDTFAELTRRGAKCLLSNADTPFIRELYGDSGFRVTTVQARRAINSNPGGRGEVNELLIRNWR